MVCRLSCCSSLSALLVLQLHMAEHPAGHLVLKWLIEQDLTLEEAGKEGKKTHIQEFLSLSSRF